MNDAAWPDLFWLFVVSLLCMTIQMCELALRNRRLHKENERLKKGEFTEEEFQNLCHQFSCDDVQRFKQGCLDYQKKLFGDKA